MPNIAFPKEFIENISPLLPSHLNLESFIESCQTPLRRSIRINRLKETDRKHLEKELGPLEPIPWCSDGYWLTQEPDFSLGNHVAHLTGQFYIQEASSMLPPMALEFAAQQADIKPQLVLDMASAPGSKTTQLAAMMENSGAILANEYSSSRLKVLAANLLRCGVSNTALCHFDAKVFGAALPNTFDAVQLDAPCSGEGAIRKDLDAFKNWSLASVQEIASVQKGLIESAFHTLKPGGVLIYSTCTLNHYENQEVCQHLLTNFEGMVEPISLVELFAGAARCATYEGYLHVWPQEFDSEGFFIAAFKKTQASNPANDKVKRPGKFPYIKASTKTRDELESYLKQQDIQLPQEMALYQRESVFWLFPKAIEPLFGMVRFDRVGIKLAEQFKKKYRLAHEFAISCPDSFNQHRLELSALQAKEFLQGKDIRGIENLPKQGDCLVLYQGQPLGLGKSVSGRLKNGLPREIVRDQPVI